MIFLYTLWQRYIILPETDNPQFYRNTHFQNKALIKTVKDSPAMEVTHPILEMTARTEEWIPDWNQKYDK